VPPAGTASASSSTQSNLRSDPHATESPRNLDYLLQDDESPRRGGGAAKFVLILLALALAVGLGYLRWKNQAFPWLNPSPKPAATQSADDSSSPSSNQTPAPPTSDSNRPPAGTVGPPSENTAINAASTPPVDASTANAPSATSPANPPAAAPSTNVPAGTPTNTAPKAGEAKLGDQAKAVSEHTAADRPVNEQPAPKPQAPLKPLDPVAEANKYLYGRGARQDCDRGLRSLKPAAEQGNAKAAMQMGALYSSGTCVPRDLPTAYRWYARTLHKDPDNQQAQAELQKLWGEMTQPERQLAIRLTQ
jgi:hypothetical protein